jgi:hypothetical protein
MAKLVWVLSFRRHAYTGKAIECWELMWRFDA